jgi:hypothetical protein
MFRAIKEDDVDEVSSLLDMNNLYLTQVPQGVPKILTQNPPLISLAAFFGAFRCLQFFLEQGMDLFTPDKKVFLFCMEFLLLISPSRPFRRCQWTT